MCSCPKSGSRPSRGSAKKLLPAYRQAGAEGASSCFQTFLKLGSIFGS